MLRVATFLIGVVAITAGIPTAMAAAPPLVNYQAQLLDGSGNPVADGNYSITFRILDAESGGTVLWTETQSSVAIAGGNLSTLLGSVTPLDDAVFAGTAAYLEIQIGAETLAPRSRLVSTGYAHRISTVDGAKAGLLQGALEVRADSNPGTALKVSESGGQPALEVNVDAAGNAAADMAGTMTVRAPAGGGTALTVADNGGTPALEVSVDGAGVTSANLAGTLTLHAEDGGSTPFKVVKASGGNSSFEITLDAAGNAVASILNPVDEKAGPGAVPTKVASLSAQGFTIFGATEADTNASIQPDGNITTKGSMTIGDTTAATDLLVKSSKPNTAEFHNFNDGGHAAGVYASVHSTVAAYPTAMWADARSTDSTGIGVYVQANYIGVQSYALRQDGVGTCVGVNGLGLGGASAIAVSGFSSGARASNYGTRGIARDATTNYGVWGTASGGTTNWAGYFDGDVNVTGTLSKGAGAFRIDHPLDPARKYLQHSFVESPEMMNVYNGNVTLDARGEARVDLPVYFEALNRDFRYQLTAIGTPGPGLYVAQEVENNSFRIAGGQPGSKVSWQVTGVRHDAFAEAHRIQVEVDKLPAERDRYLYPELLNKPEEMAIDFDARKSAREVPVNLQERSPSDR